VLEGREKETGRMSDRPEDLNPAKAVGRERISFMRLAVVV
jgi:hypothetical protein